MSETDIGWVVDQATSQRRLHLTVTPAALVGLTLEVYGQQHCVMELDEDGVVLLQFYLDQARRCVVAAQAADG